MTRSSLKSDNHSPMSLFEELLVGISTIISNVSDEERQVFLNALRDSPLRELLEDLMREERRRYRRRDCSMEIDCASWRGPFDGTVKDISLGGMFVETDTLLPPGEEITVSLFPSRNAEPIRITGQIIWSPRRGFGVRFTSPLSKHLKNIIEAL